MKALLIEVLDWTTGERAGISPDDLRPGGKYAGKLISASTLTQSLGHEPKGDYEIRLVRDPDLDLSELEALGGEVVLDDGTIVKSPITSPDQIPAGREIVDVNGVVILEGEAAINCAVDAAIPDKFDVPDIEAFRAWCRENKVGLKPDPKLGLYPILRAAYAKGCPHVVRRPEPRVKDGRWVLG